MMQRIESTYAGCLEESSHYSSSGINPYLWFNPLEKQLICPARLKGVDDQFKYRRTTSFKAVKHDKCIQTQALFLKLRFEAEIRSINLSRERSMCVRYKIEGHKTLSPKIIFTSNSDTEV